MHIGMTGEDYSSYRNLQFELLCIYQFLKNFTVAHEGHTFLSEIILGKHFFFSYYYKLDFMTFFKFNVSLIRGLYLATLQVYSINSSGFPWIFFDFLS